MRPPHVRFLAVLLAVYVAKQVLTVLLFPPFTGHDELAHFQYVRILATDGRVPRLLSDSLPADLYQYKAYSIAWETRDGAPLYTAVHPPLYYALMVPVYRLSEGMSPEGIQYVLRLAAIPVGVAVVLLAHRLTAAMFPGDAFLAVTVPTLVAFQPQVSYAAAIVNNDALGIATVSLLLYLYVIVVRDGPTPARSVLVGAAAGLALLAKATAAVPVALLPLAFYFGQRHRRFPLLVRDLGIAAVPLLCLVGPWWGFMTRVYGDPLALSALASTQPGLVRDEPFLNLLFSGTFLVDRGRESWGEFGWRLIHVSDSLTAALAAVGVMALLGLCTHVVAPHSTRDWDRWQGRAVIVLVAACVLSYLATAQFGTRFVLTQARYYFSVVNAGALLTMLGLAAWIPARWRVAARGAVVLAAIAVNVTIYTAYVVPYWYFRP